MLSSPSPLSAEVAAGHEALRAALSQGGGAEGSDGLQQQPQPQEAADAVTPWLGRHRQELPQPDPGGARPPCRPAQQVRPSLPGHPALPSPRPSQDL